MGVVISSDGKISKDNDENVVENKSENVENEENESAATIDDVLSAVNELSTTSALMEQIKHIAEALDEFLDKVRFEDATDENKSENENDKTDNPKGDVSDIDLETPLEELFN